MKTAIKITPSNELASLSPADQLANMGYERSEETDKRGKKIVIYSKDGIDYQFRGRIPSTGEIELIPVLD